MIPYLADLIEREGGYVDHPSDKGGPTNWGITEATARDYGYKGRMQDLTRDVAEDIYVKRYWFEPRFNEVNKVSDKLAEEMLDTGVNMGTSIPGRFLQRALNVLNQRGTIYPDLEVDGRIGPATIGALKRLIAHRGDKRTINVIMRLMDAQQAVRYMELAEAKETQEDFMFGWIANRISAARDM